MNLRYTVRDLLEFQYVILNSQTASSALYRGEEVRLVALERAKSQVRILATTVKMVRGTFDVEK